MHETGVPQTKQVTQCMAKYALSERQGLILVWKVYQYEGAETSTSIGEMRYGCGSPTDMKVPSP